MIDPDVYKMVIAALKDYNQAKTRVKKAGDEFYRLTFPPSWLKVEKGYLEAVKQELADAIKAFDMLGEKKW